MTGKWTVEKVIEEAAKLPGWYSVNGGVRRKTRTRETQCPVCAAVGFGLESYADVARTYGIPYSVAHAVARAADGFTDEESIRIRAAMLTAFGLSEADPSSAGRQG